MPKLIEGQALVYECYDGVVYARYRDPPYNTMYERWIVGGDPSKVAIAKGALISYNDWENLHCIAEKYPEFKKQLQKLIKLYYLYKEN